MKTRLKILSTDAGNSNRHLILSGDRELIIAKYNSLYNWGATGTPIFDEDNKSNQAWINENCLRILVNWKKLKEALYNIAFTHYKMSCLQMGLLPHNHQKQFNKIAKKWAVAQMARIQSVSDIDEKEVEPRHWEVGFELEAEWNGKISKINARDVMALYDKLGIKLPKGGLPDDIRFEHIGAEVDNDTTITENLATQVSK